MSQCLKTVRQQVARPRSKNSNSRFTNNNLVNFNSSLTCFVAHGSWPRKGARCRWGPGLEPPPTSNGSLQRQGSSTFVCVLKTSDYIEYPFKRKSDINRWTDPPSTGPPYRQTVFSASPLWASTCCWKVLYMEVDKPPDWWEMRCKDPMRILLENIKSGSSFG